VSNQGRKQEVLDRIIQGVLEDATVKQIQAVLKHHNANSSGNKAELKQAAVTLWTKHTSTGISSSLLVKVAFFFPFHSLVILLLLLD
jgi:hypothetical protein